MTHHPMTSNEPEDTVCGSSVAVVTRTKDRPLLLPRALASVLSQKHQNWHLYLVNDGGDAEALEGILQAYRPVFAGRLTVIHHETSQGMEAASNSALALVTEDFFIIHDDDDSWHPEFLSAAVSFLNVPENSHYLAVTTGCVVIREIIENDQVRQIDRQVWCKHSTADFGRMIFGNLFPPICLLFRSCVLKTVGMFDATLPVLGDWEYNLRLMKHGDIGFVSRKLAFYHQRVAGTFSAYSNTTVDHNDAHDLQNILLRNRLLRECFAAEPHLFALTQTLTKRVNDEAEGLHQQAFHLKQVINERMDILQEMIIRHNADALAAQLSDFQHESRYRLEKLEKQLWHLEVQISRLFGLINALVRPIRWIWRKAGPLRKVIARLRGRI